MQDERQIHCSTFSCRFLLSAFRNRSPESLGARIAMCLYYDATQTNKLRKYKRPITVYKYYVVDGSSKLKNPFYNQIPVVISRTGIIRSNRKSKERNVHEKYEQSVNRGIHVYLKKPNLPRWMRDRNAKWLDVTAESNDLIGAYNGEAVFMKIKVDREIMGAFPANVAPARKKANTKEKAKK